MAKCLTYDSGNWYYTATTSTTTNMFYEPFKITTPKPEPTGYLPFYTPETSPAHFERTNVKYESRPLYELSELKKAPLFYLLLDILTFMPKGTYIAGGFMRSLLENDSKANDIDFFFNGSEAFGKMIDLLQEGKNMLGKYTCKETLWDVKLNSSGYRVLNFEPTRAGRPPIQLVKLGWYDSPEAVIDQFDLTCVQVATDGTRLYYNPQALTDISNKKLRAHKQKQPLSTINRLMKYEKKGYDVDLQEFKNVADKAAHILLNTRPDKLGEHFTGMYMPQHEPVEKNVLKWVRSAWKYLIQSDNGRAFYEMLFGTKELVRADLKAIELKIEKQMWGSRTETVNDDKNYAAID